MGGIYTCLANGRCSVTLAAIRGVAVAVVVIVVILLMTSPHLSLLEAMLITPGGKYMVCTLRVSFHIMQTWPRDHQYTLSFQLGQYLRILSSRFLGNAINQPG